MNDINIWLILPRVKVFYFRKIIFWHNFNLPAWSISLQVNQSRNKHFSRRFYVRNSVQYSKTGVCVTKDSQVDRKQPEGINTRLLNMEHFCCTRTNASVFFVLNRNTLQLTLHFMHSRMWSTFPEITLKCNILCF